jgi:hypothetical protein
MKERIQEQLGHELKQASRTDTTITVIAIVVTFILFGMAYGFASAAVGFNFSFLGDNATSKLSVSATATLFVSLIAIAVINLYTILALRNNAKRKVRLAESLAKLYQEEGMPPYSPDDISMGYRARGNVFVAILSTLAAMGIIIPLIVFVNQIVEKL